MKKWWQLWLVIIYRNWLEILIIEEHVEHETLNEEGLFALLHTGEEHVEDVQELMLFSMDLDHVKEVFQVHAFYS